MALGEGFNIKQYWGQIFVEAWKSFPEFKNKNKFNNGQDKVKTLDHQHIFSEFLESGSFWNELAVFLLKNSENMC